MNFAEATGDLSRFSPSSPHMEKAMKVLQSVLDAAQFVFDGFIEIFSDTDNYPMVGFQPYEGEIY